MTDEMNHPRLTRRQLLESTAGLGVAGLGGCVGARSGSAAGQPGTTHSEDEQSGGDSHPGHGEEAHGHDAVSEPKGAREVVVNTARFEDSTEYHFDPHVTWVDVGGTVTWRRESGTHTATAYHPGNDHERLVPEGTAAWDSGPMTEDGETFEHTFETEGVYHYLCRPHEQFGMITTVIVGKPHLDDQRALGMMPDDKPEAVHGKLEELNTMVREIMGEDHHEEDTDHHGKDDHHDEAETDTDG